MIATVLVSLSYKIDEEDDIIEFKNTHDMNIWKEQNDGSTITFYVQSKVSMKHGKVIGAVED